MSSYFLLKKGEFAYNKSYSAGFDYGSIKRLERHEEGVLSSLYICFALENANPEFMTHYFDSLRWYRDMNSICGEGARNHGLLNCSAKDFFDIRITIPLSEAEQEKISSFFQLLDKKIFIEANKLAKLQSIKQNLLIKTFTGQYPSFKLHPSRSKKLSSIVEISGGHTPSMTDKSLWEHGKNTWLTSKDIKRDYLTDSEMKISDKALKNLRQYPANSMVLVARSGILKHSLPLALVRTPFTVNQDLKVLQVKEDNPEFIFFALKAKTRKILQNFVKSGTTVQSLMMPELMQMELEIPDKATQDRIANFFILFDKKIEAQQKKLTSLNRLKQSLMQQMFA